MHCLAMYILSLWQYPRQLPDLTDDHHTFLSHDSRRGCHHVFHLHNFHLKMVSSSLPYPRHPKEYICRPLPQLKCIAVFHINTTPVSICIFVIVNFHLADQTVRFFLSFLFADNLADNVCPSRINRYNHSLTRHRRNCRIFRIPYLFSLSKIQIIGIMIKRKSIYSFY